MPGRFLALLLAPPAAIRYFACTWYDLPCKKSGALEYARCGRSASDEMSVFINHIHAQQLPDVAASSICCCQARQLHLVRLAAEEANIS